MDTYAAEALAQDYTVLAKSVTPDNVHSWAQVIEQHGLPIIATIILTVGIVALFFLAWRWITGGVDSKLITIDSTLDTCKSDIVTLVAKVVELEKLPIALTVVDKILEGRTQMLSDMSGSLKLLANDQRHVAENLDRITDYIIKKAKDEGGSK